jgi:GDP-L-fucose synthase
MIVLRKLAAMIAAEIGFAGRIEWDTSKPNGQPRRCMDVRRAKQLFDFQATQSLQAGLKKTIQWFHANHDSLREVTF